jgi:hypothetical protein
MTFRVQKSAIAGNASVSLLAVVNQPSPLAYNVTQPNGRDVGTFGPFENKPIRVVAVRVFNAQTASSPSAALGQLQLRRCGNIVIGGGSSVSIVSLNSNDKIPLMRDQAVPANPSVLAFAGGTIPGSPAPVIIRDVQRQFGQLIASTGAGFEQRFVREKDALLYVPDSSEQPLRLNPGESCDVFAGSGFGAFVMNIEIDFDFE